MTWNRDDLAAGLAFLGIGLFFGVNTLMFLPVGSSVEMGPGFFPLALCTILGLLGAAILSKARRAASDPQERPPINLRAVFFITAAPAVFGLALRDLGLVPALVISTASALAASRVIGLRRAVTIVAGMTVFCVAVFYYGLRVPVELFNLDVFN